MTDEIISTDKDKFRNENKEKDKEKAIRKNMMCNHCTYECENYDKMREHYKSEFHKYNLNRVTMNLNPLVYSDYLKKKEAYQKKMDEMNKMKMIQTTTQMESKCDLCKKKFSSNKKFTEHMQSKAHLKLENEAKEKEKDKDKNKETVKDMQIESIPIETQKVKGQDKTTLDDETICLFCNVKNESLEKNVFHMVDIHKLDIPFLFCIENYHKLIDLLAKKIFKHNACLTCDTQKFNSHYALQSHMVDKAHTRINNEDLDEYLYKLYDMKKVLALKDTTFRKMEEYKILSLRHKVALRLKENKKKGKGKEKVIKEEEGDDDEWEVESDEKEVKDDVKEKSKEKKVKDKVDDKEVESDGEFEPMELPNGELLLEDGTVLGSKIYNVYYNQRIHISKYDNLKKKVQESMAAKIRKKKRLNRKDYRKMRNSLQGSNKSNFQRINSLFKAAPQS